MSIPRRRPAPRPVRARRALLAPGLAILGLLAAACVPSPPVGGVEDPNPLRSTLIANHWGRHLEPTLTDVAYGLGPQHRLDVLRTTSATSRGTIVFVHGGGFVMGDKSQLLAGQNGAIVYQHTRGWDIVSVGYTIGEGTYPAGYHDVALAVSWVKEQGAELGLDTSTVVLAGHSAGAALTSMVATTAGATTPYGEVPRVDRWVAVAGFHDFVDGTAYLTEPWGLPVADRPTTSPLGQLDASDPRGYLIHGDADPIVRPLQSDRMRQRATVVGADVRYDLVDSGPMSCRMHDPLCGANLSALNSFLS